MSGDDEDIDDDFDWEAAAAFAAEGSGGDDAESGDESWIDREFATEHAVVEKAMIVNAEAKAASVEAARSRTRRYKLIHAGLGELEAHIASIPDEDAASAREDVDKIRSVLAESQRHNITLIEDIKRLEGQIELLEEQLATAKHDYEETLEQKKYDRKKYEDNIEKYSDALNVCREEHKTMTSTLKRSDVTLSRMKKQMERLKEHAAEAAEAAAAEKASIDCAHEKANMRSNIIRLKQKLKDRTDDANAAEQQVSTERLRKRKRSNEESKIRNKNQIIRNKNQTLSRTNEDLTRTLGQLEHDLTEEHDA